MNKRNNLKKELSLFYRPKKKEKNEYDLEMRRNGYHVQKF
jgi:hypothetical protein